MKRNGFKSFLSNIGMVWFLISILFIVWVAGYIVWSVCR